MREIYQFVTVCSVLDANTLSIFVECYVFYIMNSHIFLHLCIQSMAVSYYVLKLTCYLYKFTHVL